MHTPNERIQMRANQIKYDLNLLNMNKKISFIGS